MGSNRKLALQWASKGNRRKGRPKEWNVENESISIGWKIWEVGASAATDRKMWKMCSALCRYAAHLRNPFDKITFLIYDVASSLRIPYVVPLRYCTSKLVRSAWVNSVIFLPHIPQ